MRIASKILIALALFAGCSNDPSIAGHPARISLSLASPSLYFERGGELSVVATVEDFRGEPLFDTVVNFEVDAPERASIVANGTQDATYALSDTGSVRVTGCADGLDDLCDSLLVAVDDGSPVLVIESPMPGAELSDAAGIVVSGTVVDATQSLTLFVNGQTVTRDANAHFSTTIPAEFGVRHLEIVATDLLTESTRAEFDVLWAPTFTPATDPSGAPAFTLDSALALSLGQLAFDDEAAYVDATPVHTQDLADIVEVVLARADVTSVVPDPVFDSGGLTLRLIDPALSDPRVEISVLDDGIDLYVRVGSISGTTAGHLTIGGDSFDLAGTLSAGVSAYARLTIQKPSRDANVIVSLSGLEVAIDSIDATFTDPEVDAIFALATGLLRTTLETQVENALSGLLTDTVPALLEGVLSGIDHALENKSIALNQAPLPPVSLTLDGRIGSITSLYRDQLVAELSMSVASASANAHPESLGFARIADTAIAPSVFHDGEIQVGVQLGLLNGLLHVLWSSGLLDIDASALIPSSFATIVSNAKLTARLPPVARPPHEAESADAVLTIGQLELELRSEGGLHRYGVRIELPIDLSLANNRFAVAFPTDPVFTLWVIEEPDDPGIVSVNLLQNLLEGLWPKLAGTLSGGLGIDLPIPPLTALTSIAPSLDGFTIAIGETSTSLHTRGELLILDAAIEGHTP